AAFDRAFDFWPPRRRDEDFDALWHGPRPRHEDLLAIASDPRGLQSSHAPVPGASCPLCGFATFVWADVTGMAESTTAAIRHECPQWTTDQGACGRCVEIYRRVGAQLRAAI